MRLMSTNAKVPYIDVIDREGQKPDGKPVKGHTTFYFRALTSAERGVIMDSMFDLGKSTVRATGDGEDAKVDMAMRISPSANRRNAVQLALIGWDGLYGAETDDKGNPLKIDFEAEDITIGGEVFSAAPGAVLDMFDPQMLQRMDAFVRSLSIVEPGVGKK
jgi:hypothetical protein